MPRPRNEKLRAEILKLYKQMIEAAESGIPRTVQDIINKTGASRDTVYQVINNYVGMTKMPEKEAQNVEG
jgi:DNA invertase Pin-like site-specific DNA recombinase